MTDRAHPPAAGVLGELAARGQTLATAESLTGGGLAALLTDVPGASRSYLGGVVSYATEVKTGVLGVPAAVVEEYGVVSGPCAVAMAEAARSLLGATYAVSTTGVAGPDPQEGRPPGTVFVGIATPTGSELLELRLSGDRRQIREATCAAALDALSRAVSRDDPGLG